jgi:hypothetical protein
MIDAMIVIHQEIITWTIDAMVVVSHQENIIETTDAMNTIETTDEESEVDLVIMVVIIKC